MTTNDDLLSINDVTALLGISRTALYTIVDERHELPVADERMVGNQRRRFFRRSDVLALKRQREGGGNECIGRGRRQATPRPYADREGRRRRV